MKVVQCVQCQAHVEVPDDGLDKEFLCPRCAVAFKAAHEHELADQGIMAATSEAVFPATRRVTQDAFTELPATWRRLAFPVGWPKTSSTPPPSWRDVRLGLGTLSMTLEIFAFADVLTVVLVLAGLQVRAFWVMFALLSVLLLFIVITAICLASGVVGLSLCLAAPRSRIWIQYCLGGFAVSVGCVLLLVPKATSGEPAFISGGFLLTVLGSSLFVGAASFIQFLWETAQYFRNRFLAWNLVILRGFLIICTAVTVAWFVEPHFHDWTMNTLNGLQVDVREAVEVLVCFTSPLIFLLWLDSAIRQTRRTIDDAFLYYLRFQSLQ